MITISRLLVLSKFVTSVFVFPCECTTGSPRNSRWDWTSWTTRKTSKWQHFSLIFLRVAWKRNLSTNTSFSRIVAFFLLFFFFEVMRSDRLLLDLHYPPVSQKPNTYIQLEAATALPSLPYAVSTLGRVQARPGFKERGSKPPKQT